MDFKLFKDIQESIKKFIVSHQGCLQNEMFTSLNKRFHENDIQFVLNTLENNYTTFFNNYGRIFSINNRLYHFNENDNLARKHKSVIKKLMLKI